MCSHIFVGPLKLSGAWNATVDNIASFALASYPMAYSTLPINITGGKLVLTGVNLVSSSKLSSNLANSTEKFKLCASSGSVLGISGSISTPGKLNPSV